MNDSKTRTKKILTKKEDKVDLKMIKEISIK